jgi:hypothetical protein
VKNGGIIHGRTSIGVAVELGRAQQSNRKWYSNRLVKFELQTVSPTAVIYRAAAGQMTSAKLTRDQYSWTGFVFSLITVLDDLLQKVI